MVTTRSQNRAVDTQHVLRASASRNNAISKKKPMHSQRGTKSTSRNPHVPSRAQSDEYTQLLKDILNEKRSKDYTKVTNDQMEDAHRLKICIERLVEINDLQAQRLSNSGRRPSATSRRLKLCTSQVVKVITMLLPISKIRSEMARVFSSMLEQNDVLARLHRFARRCLIYAVSYIQKAGVISVAACYVLNICKSGSSDTIFVEYGPFGPRDESGCLRSFSFRVPNGTTIQYIPSKQYGCIDLAKL